MMNKLFGASGKLAELGEEKKREWIANARVEIPGNFGLCFADSVGLLCPICARHLLQGAGRPLAGARGVFVQDY